MSFGINAVAAAFLIGAYALLPLNLYWTQKYAAVPITTYLRQLARIAVATVLMAVAVVAIKFALGTTGPLTLVTAEVAVGALTFALAARLLEPRLLHEAFAVGRHVLPRGGDARRKPRPDVEE